jgi:hypothetical protein
MSGLFPMKAHWHNQELEELASVDTDDSSDTASALQIVQDAASISWLKEPGVDRN